MEYSEVILYILVCIPIVILVSLLCFMNDTQNKQTKPVDTDRLAVDMSQHKGKRCIDAGYKFWCTPPITYDNVTLIYIRNYGSNVTWFHFSPGWTIIDQTLIDRISSLKMNVPDQFRAFPHNRKTG